MQKSLIEHYMTKVAEGDTSYLQRLCYQLSDRLIYIPALQINKSQETTKVEVVKLINDSTSYVPVFTSEKRYRTWKEGVSQATDSISLLGGDLCAVLGLTTGVIIDPGADNSVRLAPHIVANIANDALSSDQNSEDSELQESELVTSKESAANSNGTQSNGNYQVHTWAEVEDITVNAVEQNGNGSAANEMSNTPAAGATAEPLSIHNQVCIENSDGVQNGTFHSEHSNGANTDRSDNSANYLEEDAARVAFSGNNAVEVLPAVAAPTATPVENLPAKKKTLVFTLFRRH